MNHLICDFVSFLPLIILQV